MKNINWGADFNLLYARYYSKYLVDGKEYNQTLNEFKYSNIINPNNSISIGNTCSSSVTFSIFKPQITLENKDITIFEGVKGDSGIEYVQIGIFTVTKEESNGEYTKYTAYDKMYKAEKGYFSELTYPSTDKAILEEICTKLGIQLATSITNTHTITDKPQGYTMREMIGYMAMLQGGNAAINSDGNLEIKWYKDSGYVLDGHQYYQQGVTFTTSKDFTIRKLTCNNTKSGDKETSTITSGSGTIGLSFANPFMTQANLNEIYNKIGGFQFRPLTVKFLGDWRLEVGDIITVNKGGVDYKVPIMQITHECDGGLMDTVTSIGQSDTENSNIASGPITKQMERYYADLVLINKAVIENADITSANIENLKAHQAYIDQLKANKIETVTADIVNLTANKATINEANIAKLQADYAQVGVLNADVADIKTLMFGSATGKSLTTEFANAVVSVIGNAQINYSTTTVMKNAITQAVKAESNSIKLEVSNAYATKDSLSSYSTTTQMNAAISTAISKESSAIKLEVAGAYATKDSLKNYATTASLSAYIKKDPKSGELKSAIEAIADDITLKAKGAINISGNKSVNISGNAFTLTSTNTIISATGTITCSDIIGTGGRIGNWDITDGSLKNDYLAPDGYLRRTYIQSSKNIGDWIFSVQKGAVQGTSPSTLNSLWHVTNDGEMQFNVESGKGIKMYGSAGLELEVLRDRIELYYQPYINGEPQAWTKIEKGKISIDSKGWNSFGDCALSVVNSSIKTTALYIMHQTEDGSYYQRGCVINRNPFSGDIMFDWDGRYLRGYIGDNVVITWDNENKNWI